MRNMSFDPSCDIIATFNNQIAKKQTWRTYLRTWTCSKFDWHVSASTRLTARARHCSNKYEGYRKPRVCVIQNDQKCKLINFKLINKVEYCTLYCMLHFREHQLEWSRHAHISTRRHSPVLAALAVFLTALRSTVRSGDHWTVQGIFVVCRYIKWDKSCRLVVVSSVGKNVHK